MKKYISKFHYLTLDLPLRSHVEQTAIACKAGANWVQYRCLTKSDAELVEEFQGPALKQAGWVIQSSDQVARGDCLIETGSNRIDASIDSKWQKLAIAMGKKPTEDQI
jgi:flagellar biosynthesis/type III secretory pathway protein FliH